MTQDELKLVLDALKFCHGGEPCGTAEAITVVEEALAQPEQEPVIGTKTWFEDGKVVTQYLYPSDIYTTPSQRTWVGLTDEERLEAAEIDGADEWFWKVCKAIEAKLKEKNT